MGQDGVAGLKAARKLGGRILAQDEASCVVFGMPGAAVAAGVVDHVLSPAAVAQQLITWTPTRGNDE
jgi:two-component system chemotaxis response regulator CheB